MDPDLKKLVDTLLESQNRLDEQLAALKQKVDAVRANWLNSNGQSEGDKK